MQGRRTAWLAVAAVWFGLGLWRAAAGDGTWLSLAFFGLALVWAILYARSGTSTRAD
jgi:hypothetical protein